MATRTTRQTVTFRRPFLLTGFESEQPAGDYVVDTEEEFLESISFPAWRRVATTIRLGRNGTTEYLPIDPVELDDARAKDATQSSSNPQKSTP